MFGVIRLACMAAVTAVILSGCMARPSDVDVTNSVIGYEPIGDSPSLAPASRLKASRDGIADLNLGKRHYRERNFGLAEKHYRRAAERAPQDPETWIGLAATYDQLGRFDLADRAYEQAILLVGPTPEILNNQGYSYMLRGDFETAEKKLKKAESKAPANKYIQANLKLLVESRP